MPGTGDGNTTAKGFYPPSRKYDTYTHRRDDRTRENIGPPVALGLPWGVHVCSAELAACLGVVCSRMTGV